MSEELVNGAVERVLAELKDPETGRSALQLDQIRDVQINATDLSLTLALTTHSAPIRDTVKAMAMFQKVNIPILGMVENMSGFVCPECNKRYDIFGRGGARRCAEELHVPVLDVMVEVE